jgi:uncharacterized protein YggE
MINHKLLWVVLLGLALTGCTDSHSHTRQIQVSASGEVKAKPEVVVFDFQIEKRGTILKSLKRVVDENTAALVALCKKLGIKPKDLVAAEISIQPQYNYNTNRFTGYQVSRNVTARLYDLTKYSKVIDGAVNAGITTIQNVSLEMKGEKDLRLKALARAVEKATSKAKLLADKNGVGLGKVIQVIETGSGAYQVAYLAKQQRNRDGVAAEAAPYAFEPGRLSVASTVQISFEIK